MISPKSDTETFKSLVEIEKGSLLRGIFRVAAFCTLYSCLGLLVFHLQLGWDAFDAGYFTIVALSTVGYGDLVPKTDQERLFTSFFLLSGFVLFGAFVSMEVTTLAEHSERIARERGQRAAESIELQLQRQRHRQQSGGVLSRMLTRSVDLIMRSSSRAQGKSLAVDRANAALHGTDNTNGEAAPDALPHPPPQDTEMSVSEQLLASFDVDLDRVRMLALFNALGLVAVMIVGLLSMASIEGWSFATAWYWACQTITTVGFGDVVPKTTLGRSFTVVFILVGCGLLAASVTDAVKYPLLLRARRHEARLLEQFTPPVSETRLRALFDSSLFTRVPGLRRDDHEIAKSEFVLLALQMMNKIEDKDVYLAATLFDRLVLDGSGVLSREAMHQRLAEAKEDELERERERELLRERGASNLADLVDVIEGVLRGRRGSAAAREPLLPGGEGDSGC